MSEAQHCILAELAEATGGSRETAAMKFFCFLLLVPAALTASEFDNTHNDVRSGVVKIKAVEDVEGQNVPGRLSLLNWLHYRPHSVWYPAVQFAASGHVRTAYVPFHASAG